MTPKPTRREALRGSLSATVMLPFKRSPRLRQFATFIGGKTFMMPHVLELMRARQASYQGIPIHALDLLPVDRLRAEKSDGTLVILEGRVIKTGFRIEAYPHDDDDYDYCGEADA